MDHEIGAFRVFDHPIVRVVVTREDELETIPFQRETHRAVDTVKCREGADGNTVFLVDDGVFAAVIELVDFHCQSTKIDLAQATVPVPAVKLEHAVNGGLCSQLRRWAARTPDPEGPGATAESASHVERTQITHVVDV